MYTFNKNKFLEYYNQVYAEIPKVEKIAKEISKNNISEIYMLGCGGAFTKFMSIKDYLHHKLHIPVIVTDPEEFLLKDFNHLTDDPMFLVGTKTGVTTELLKTVKAIKQKGYRVYGFIGDKDTPLEKYLNGCIRSYNTDVHIILLDVLVLNLLENMGFNVGYDRFKIEMKDFGKDLVETISSNLDIGEAYVRKALSSDFQMWIASDNLWGEVNCYAKYMMEEVQWLPCQAVHAGEFFHGPLELIDKDFCVNVVVGISETRKMDARVVEFVKKYSDNYTIIDMKEFNLPHISKEFYYFVYPYVLNIYLDELAESFKPITGKNMETRRYYRKVSY